MKLLVAFMAGIAVAAALVTCPDKEFQCPDGDTCCQLKGRVRDGLGNFDRYRVIHLFLQWVWLT